MIRITNRAVLAAATLLALAAPVLAHDASAHDPAVRSHDAAAHAGHEDCDEIAIGNIEITGAFTRATLPNAPVAGGFLTLTNKGSEDDRLVSVSTEIAQESQIHEMAMEGDVMKMRQLKDGILVPAGETVALQPGGYHLMFMGLNGPVVEGTSVPVTLTFERAGTITVDLVAAGRSADAPAGHGGH